MDEERFIRSVRELSHFMVEQSVELDNNSAGRWRAVKQSLPNEDVKAVIYRNVSHITIIYSAVGKEKEISFDFSVRKEAEPGFYDGAKRYIEEAGPSIYSDEVSVLSGTFYFSISEFELFVYSYLLPGT